MHHPLQYQYSQKWNLKLINTLETAFITKQTESEPFDISDSLQT